MASEVLPRWVGFPCFFVADTEQGSTGFFLLSQDHSLYLVYNAVFPQAFLLILLPWRLLIALNILSNSTPPVQVRVFLLQVPGNMSIDHRCTFITHYCNFSPGPGDAWRQGLCLAHLGTLGALHKAWKSQVLEYLNSCVNQKDQRHWGWQLQREMGWMVRKRKCRPHEQSSRCGVYLFLIIKLWEKG